jgi:hypothetical protein
MSASRKVLLVAIAAAVVVGVVARLVSDEIWERGLGPFDPFDYVDLSRIYLISGVELLTVAALVVLTSRYIGVRLGVGSKVATGTGLAVAAGTLAASVHTLVAVPMYATDNWPDHLQFFIWSNRLDNVTMVLIVFAGLLIAGVRRRRAAAGALAVFVAVWAVGLTQTDPVRHSTWFEVRGWIVFVSIPLLCGLVGVALTKQRAEEPVLA